MISVRTADSARDLGVIVDSHKLFTYEKVDGGLEVLMDRQHYHSNCHA